MFTILALALGGLVSVKAVAVMIAVGALALGMAFVTSEPFIAYLISVGLCDATGALRPVKQVLAKTANYQLLSSDGSGTIFTNRAAVGAVTFTLPVPTPQLTGVHFEFHGVADQTFTVSAGAGKGVAFNNAACASLACSTGGQKIGAVIRAYCDGTSWILQGSTIGVTYTVA